MSPGDEVRVRFASAGGTRMRKGVIRDIRRGWRAERSEIRSVVVRLHDSGRLAVVHPRSIVGGA